MAKSKRKTKSVTPMSLLLVEGDTEELFYKKIKTLFLSDYRVNICNMGGLFNINAKIIDELIKIHDRDNIEEIRVYCCLDRESRYGQIPGLNLSVINAHIKSKNFFKVKGGVKRIIATQQIESWFLHDIEGIYKHLKVPRAQRNLRKYRPPERFTYKDLEALFERYNKTYYKGKKRAGNFINKLDINKIYKNSTELSKGIALIQKQGK